MKKLIFSIALGMMVASSFGQTAPAAGDEPAKKKGRGFANMDANHDGSVTTDEFKTAKAKTITDDAKLKEAFDKIDTDKDGKISEAEFKAAKAKSAASKKKADETDSGAAKE